MKLFVFRPSETWEYCDGAVLIIAEYFEQAASFLRRKPIKTPNDYEDNLIAYRSEADVDRDLFYEGYPLVLDQVLELAGEHTPGIVFNHYNYA